MGTNFYVLERDNRYNYSLLRASGIKLRIFIKMLLDIKV